MAVKQISESFQNDGNFSQLDLKDIKFKSPKMRIETFRCSQPKGKFGVTHAGTKVSALCSFDHLSPFSNCVFRHIFSVEVNNTMNGTLEIREMYNIKGAWELRIRDIDFQSESYGSMLLIDIAPSDNLNYNLQYKIIQRKISKKIKISSPLIDRISNISEELSDIGSVEFDTEKAFFETTINLSLTDRTEDVAKKLSSIRKKIQSFTTWTKNIVTYQRFGDFRDKCVHDGTNLIGKNSQLASEYLLIRAYRSSLIFLGSIADPEMYMYAGLKSQEKGISIDSKPGVYMPFLTAYFLNVGIYRLGIDKVHSDYGGIPMKLKPGSKLENGIKPIINSANANKTLADLAALFYQPDILKMKPISVENE